MGKHKQYIQKFRKEWLRDENFKKWLLEVPTDSTKGRCNYCKCDINAKYTDILRHSKSQKHKVSVPIATSNVSIRSHVSTKSCVKTAACEASISLFLSSHCAIRNCDHLVDMCKCHFSETDVGSKLKMHRTKCTEIINNVLSDHFVDDLVNDIGNGKFSLLLDESNDITINKLLGIAVIYYSKLHEKIISTFLSLVALGKCDADGIVKAVKEELAAKKLDINSLVAIGTDNASVMVGINNGVFQKLKHDVPSLILIRCTCHSLQLAVSHASSETLPRNLEFLISETYKWFSLSSVRQLSYKTLYQTINDGKTPLKIPSNCQTRWLSIEPAVGRILDQWLELKTHFEIVRSTEKCYTAEMLYGMYCDEANHAYLLFLYPVLVDIQRVNKLFESNTADQTKLFHDLSLLIRSIASKLILPTSRVDPLVSSIEEYLDPAPYLGYRFERKVKDLKDIGKLTCEREKTLRSRCQRFLMEVLKQLKQRLPENISILKNSSLLSVENALRAVKNSISSLMEYMGEQGNVIEAAEFQFRNINLIDWTNKTNTVQFWDEVFKYTDASGSNPFQELADFAMKVLILPHSNAEVERVFSQLNITKSKLRNKMGIKLVNSLLHIKYGLKRHNKCCKDYVLPAQTLQKIGSLECYKSDASKAQASTSVESSFHDNDDRDDDIVEIIEDSDSE